MQRKRLVSHAILCQFIIKSVSSVIVLQLVVLFADDGEEKKVNDFTIMLLRMWMKMRTCVRSVNNDFLAIAVTNYTWNNVKETVNKRSLHILKPSIFSANIELHSQTDIKPQLSLHCDVILIRVMKNLCHFEMQKRIINLCTKPVDI